MRIIAKQKHLNWEKYYKICCRTKSSHLSLTLKEKMSSIIKTGKLALKLSALQKVHVGSAVISVRNAWNKDFKPAPYPVTEEERAKAAKKYGIPLEKYEPYPDDGTGYGDVRLKIIFLPFNI